MTFDRNILNKGAIFAFFTFILFWFNTQGNADSFLGAAFCSIFVMLCFTFISLIAAWEKQHYQKVMAKNPITPINNYQSNRNWQQEWEESKLRRKKATYDHIIKVHNMQKKSITSVDDGVKPIFSYFQCRRKSGSTIFPKSTCPICSRFFLFSIIVLSNKCRKCSEAKKSWCKLLG